MNNYIYGTKGLWYGNSLISWRHSVHSLVRHWCIHCIVQQRHIEKCRSLFLTMWPLVPFSFTFCCYRKTRKKLNFSECSAPKFVWLKSLTTCKSGRLVKMRHCCLLLCTHDTATFCAFVCVDQLAQDRIDFVNTGQSSVELDATLYIIQSQSHRCIVLSMWIWFWHCLQQLLWEK